MLLYHKIRQSNLVKHINPEYLDLAKTYSIVYLVFLTVCTGVQIGRHSWVSNSDRVSYSSLKISWVIISMISWVLTIGPSLSQSPQHSKRYYFRSTPIDLILVWCHKAFNHFSIDGHSRGSQVFEITKIIIINAAINMLKAQHVHWVSWLEWAQEGSPRPRLLTRCGELLTPRSLAKLPHRGCENTTVPPRQGFTQQTAILTSHFQGVMSSTEGAGAGGDRQAPPGLPTAQNTAQPRSTPGRGWHSHGNTITCALEPTRALRDVPEVNIKEAKIVRVTPPPYTQSWRLCRGPSQCQVTIMETQKDGRSADREWVR